MIIDMIQESFKELLIDGIISNLSGTFDTVNTKVGEIAGEVGHDALRLERRHLQHDPQPVRNGHRSHRRHHPHLRHVL